MLNWNSQKGLNNPSSPQPERHVPLTFKNKQSLLLKRQCGAQVRACSCRRVDKTVTPATAQGSARSHQTVNGNRKTAKWANSWSSVGSSEEETRPSRAALLLLRPGHQCPPAGRGCSGARGSSARCPGSPGLPAAGLVG